jgi:hypothetical protein
MSTNSSCTITTYYNDKAHDRVVGTRTQCTGAATQNTGHTSPYHTTERLSSSSGGTGHPHNGTTQMPCELLAAGCSNLPTNRYN